MPVLMIFALICFFPILFSLKSFTGIIFDQSTSPVGDTIGGIMGPFVAIGAAILTFFAFWVQYKANEKLREDIQIDRFENKFYEFIRLHKENINELESRKGTKGRNVIENSFYELRYIYYTIKKYVQEELPEDIDVKDLGFRKNDENSILRIACVVHFFGIGENTLSTNQSSLMKICNIDFFYPLLHAKLMQVKSSMVHKIEFNDGTSLNYDPVETLEGHASQMAHYYRHLYQTVKFVDEFDIKIIKHEKKYEYMKMLRAQLSNYEQLMLFYNALLPFGNNWIKNGYIINYKLIKNIPLLLADFGIKPEDLFAKEIEELHKKGEELFEWRE